MTTKLSQVDVQSLVELPLFARMKIRVLIMPIGLSPDESRRLTKLIRGFSCFKLEEILQDKTILSLSKEVYVQYDTFIKENDVFYSQVYGIIGITAQQTKPIELPKLDIDQKLPVQARRYLCFDTEDPGADEVRYIMKLDEQKVNQCVQAELEDLVKEIVTGLFGLINTIDKMTFALPLKQQQQLSLSSEGHKSGSVEDLDSPPPAANTPTRSIMSSAKNLVENKDSLIQQGLSGYQEHIKEERRIPGRRMKQMGDVFLAAGAISKAYASYMTAVQQTRSAQDSPFLVSALEGCCICQILLGEECRFEELYQIECKDPYLRITIVMKICSYLVYKRDPRSNEWIMRLWKDEIEQLRLDDQIIVAAEMTRLFAKLRFRRKRGFYLRQTSLLLVQYLLDKLKAQPISDLFYYKQQCLYLVDCLLELVKEYTASKPNAGKFSTNNATSDLRIIRRVLDEAVYMCEMVQEFKYAGFLLSILSEYLDELDFNLINRLSNKLSYQPSDYTHAIEFPGTLKSQDLIKFLQFTPLRHKKLIDKIELLVQGNVIVSEGKQTEKEKELFLYDPYAQVEKQETGKRVVLSESFQIRVYFSMRIKVIQACLVFDSELNVKVIGTSIGDGFASLDLVAKGKNPCDIVVRGILLQLSSNWNEFYRVDAEGKALTSSVTKVQDLYHSVPADIESKFVINTFPYIPNLSVNRIEMMLYEGELSKTSFSISTNNTQLGHLLVTYKETIEQKKLLGEELYEYELYHASNKPVTHLEVRQQSTGFVEVEVEVRGKRFSKTELVLEYGPSSNCKRILTIPLHITVYSPLELLHLSVLPSNTLIMDVKNSTKDLFEVLDSVIYPLQTKRISLTIEKLVMQTDLHEDFVYPTIPKDPISIPAIPVLKTKQFQTNDYSHAIQDKNTTKKQIDTLVKKEKLLRMRFWHKDTLCRKYLQGVKYACAGRQGELYLRNLFTLDKYSLSNLMQQIVTIETDIKPEPSGPGEYSLTFRYKGNEKYASILRLLPVFFICEQEQKLAFDVLFVEGQREYLLAKEGEITVKLMFDSGVYRILFHLQHYSLDGLSSVEWHEPAIITIN